MITELFESVYNFPLPSHPLTVDGNRERALHKIEKSKPTNQLYYHPSHVADSIKPMRVSLQSIRFATIHTVAV